MCFTLRPFCFQFYARAMKILLSIFTIALVFVLGLLAYVFLFLMPGLPELDTIVDYQPKIPLRVYTADKVLIGEFGEEHRDFVAYKDTPKELIDAVIAIEDERFFEHQGIDYKSMARALFSTVTGGGMQGGGTITMQVARNFYLTREKTLTRKLREMLLANRIEKTLSKEKILELYLNQIYLGQRSHGFSSAASTYFGKTLKQLNLAEIAMLAGLPKNPARHNPITNFERAQQRQHVVLKSMLRQEKITEKQLQQAQQQEIKVLTSSPIAPYAAYVAEMVRQEMLAQYKDTTYTMGLQVVTTISSREQEAAYEAVRRSVFNYDKRSGYRGPEAFMNLPEDEAEREDKIDEFLAKHPSGDKIYSAIVTEAKSTLIKAEMANGVSIEINGEGLRLAQGFLSEKTKAEKRIRAGALIRVAQDTKKRWYVTQMPEVEAAYVALNALDGSYQALVGGFDFKRRNFNHVTQAWRQPGSAIKPFIYSAALEKGFYPGTQINDVQLSETTESNLKWDPRNDDGKYDGPVSMQDALAKSKNVIAVRILQAIGANYGRQYLTKFGFEQDKQPDNLTLALGTGSVTPNQLVSAYAVFANGGYQVKPWLIHSVKDGRGKELYVAPVVLPYQEENRVIDSRNAFVMDSMLREVTHTGTAAAATPSLGRQDLAGKTGTTSDAVDGWFAGYASHIVAVAWMGFDEPKSLGRREFGSTVALPIWIESMRAALAGKAPKLQTQPEHLLHMDGKWMYEEYEGSGVQRLGFPEQEDVIP